MSKKTKQVGNLVRGDKIYTADDKIRTVAEISNGFIRFTGGGRPIIISYKDGESSQEPHWLEAELAS